MTAAGRAAGRARRRIEELVAAIARPRGAVEGDLVLTRRNVFILPTRAGFLYATALATMLIASINYALSLGFALTFLLGAVALASMLQTFRNLSALTLRPGRCEPVFAGQPAELNLLLLNRGGLERFALMLSLPDAISEERLDVAAGAEQPARLAIPTRRRGWMPIPRITLRTEYPLGLWRAWSWWQPAVRVLVLPVPEAGMVPAAPASTGREAGSITRNGEDDLAGIRPWRSGDPPQRIAWRAMAASASDALLSKQFEGGAAGDLLLDWDGLPGTMDTEARLSRLTRWVIDAHDSGARWELRLRGRRFGPDRGSVHRERCLEALAVLETSE